MAIKKYKPTSPGRRFMTSVVHETDRKNAPHKPLVRKLSKKGGRDNRGKIAVRHRGGGHNRRYRMIDFKRDKFGIPAKVETIEYDPNRSANIALLCYADGELLRPLAPAGPLPDSACIDPMKRPAAYRAIASDPRPPAA